LSSSMRCVRTPNGSRRWSWQPMWAASRKIIQAMVFSAQELEHQRQRETARQRADSTQEIPPRAGRWRCLDSMPGCTTRGESLGLCRVPHGISGFAEP
jgi:hypothetical protein